LDWLAAEFVSSGWDRKRLHRMIVTSATYCQSSLHDQGSLDPHNRWLARAPRRRLSAEMIRDHVLAASRLLDGRLGGRSVPPWQPAGLWRDVSFHDKYTAQVFTASVGGDAHRRSVYTFYKRACPPPTLALFDIADRNVCAVGRGETNSPLQALALMNDRIFQTASLAIAGDLLRIPRSERFDEAALRLFSRRLEARERDVLDSYVESQLEIWRDSPDRAREFISSIGGADAPANVDSQREVVELAVWSLAVQAMICSDAALVRN
jgi:hypothetical protein